MIDQTSADHSSRWPNAARCVVAITIDFDGPSLEIGRGRNTLGIYSHGRYSAKCGIPRYLRILEETGIPATFFVPGYDAEQHPQSVREIVGSGHEVAAHGYVHEGWDLGDEEPFFLQKTHEILTDLVGAAPLGWRSPSGHKSARTMRALKRLGYIYDSSDKDRDLPYLAEFGGRVHDNLIILPNNTSSLDDFPFYRVSYTPPSEVLAHWIEEYEAIRAEGGYFNLTLHPRVGYGSGSPARAHIVKELIEYIKESGDAQFVNLAQFADWCLKSPRRWLKTPPFVNGGAA
ncbi:polysaccharide deacetylase family protein [Rhizobium azibense]|uniref:Chitooligosaccharide deacetylase n=1 Tax=Rhizobium azibense TaxID=1136135 RepID=A0A4R3REF7_9HYPH|nr:polysaccharide deacetylase family protein [Rhizobium azibense]TCU33913.1 peptidoglycan/xylan/chitin deacetylase (PgdA/CDA1 family) [Rhizobium azibense]